MLLPEKCIAAYAEAAMRNGAGIHAHEVVKSWTSDARGATVATDRATYHAERIVFCGGAWNGKLAADFGIELPVTRQTLLWVWPKEPALFGADRIPVWGIGQPDGSLYYGFPMGLDDSVGLKFAHHKPGPVVNPDTIAREPQAGDEATLRDAMRKYLPRGDGPTLALRVCMYSNSPDCHFILDRHPKHERALCGFACSGHGFKFASVVGEVLADLAVSGKTELPAQFLGLSRFSQAPPQ
jgi:sarcosine oxidase